MCGRDNLPRDLYTMTLVTVDDKGHKRCLQSHILSRDPRNYVLFLSLLVMVTATSTEKYRCLFEQLEHYLGGIIWGAKNDQVGVIFSVILHVVIIAITASLSHL